MAIILKPHKIEKKFKHNEFLEHLNSLPVVVQFPILFKSFVEYGFDYNKYCLAIKAHDGEEQKVHEFGYARLWELYKDARDEWGVK